jgi:hypothetical protein
MCEAGESLMGAYVINDHEAARSQDPLRLFHLESRIACRM